MAGLVAAVDDGITGGVCRAGAGTSEGPSDFGIGDGIDGGFGEGV